jgi:multidrug efflux system membrane fusion protein
LTNIQTQSRWTLAATAALVLLAPSLAPAQTADPVSVTVSSVEQRNVPVYLDYVGSTEAVRSIAVQAKATGFLASRGAPDGADVREGDLLYKIDPRDYQASLDQVTAQAKRNAAALDYARVSQGRKPTSNVTVIVAVPSLALTDDI